MGCGNVLHAVLTTATPASNYLPQALYAVYMTAPYPPNIRSPQESADGNSEVPLSTIILKFAEGLYHPYNILHSVMNQSECLAS